MNKNKKKILVIALLLFVAIGFTGYGAYSYYWTQGDIANNDEDGNAWITISGEFDPQVDGSFINNGSLSLTCGEVNITTGQVTCTGELSVYNNGDTSIDLSVESQDSYASISNFEGSVDSFTYSWDDTTISPDEYATVTVSTTVNVDMGVNDNEPEEVSSPVEVDGSIEANLRIKATQVHY